MRATAAHQCVGISQLHRLQSHPWRDWPHILTVVVHILRLIARQLLLLWFSYWLFAHRRLILPTVTGLSLRYQSCLLSNHWDLLLLLIELCVRNQLMLTLNLTLTKIDCCRFCRILMRVQLRSTAKSDALLHLLTLLELLLQHL